MIQPRYLFHRLLAPAIAQQNSRISEGSYWNDNSLLPTRYIKFMKD